MLSRLNIRTKLLLVALVPMLVLAAVTTASVLDRWSRRNTAVSERHIVDVQLGAARAVNEMGQERLLSTALLAGRSQAGLDQLSDQIDATDASVQSFIDGVSARIDLDGDVADRFRSSVARFRTQVNELVTIRELVNSGQDEPLEIVNGYSGLISRMIGISALLADIPGGRVELSASQDLMRANEANSRETALIAALFNEKLDFREVIESARESAAAESTTTMRAYQNQKSTDVERRRYSQAVTSDEYQASRVVVSRIRDGVDPTDLDLSVARWVEIATARASKLNDVLKVNLDDQLANARSEESAAVRSASIFLGLAVPGAVFAALAALLVARSIRRTLKSISGAATQISTESLPGLVDSLTRPDVQIPPLVPIRVKTRDEIGELAAALNAVQSTTRQVAADQSEVLRRGISQIFVNLARRNQTLLDRQIEFIDRLEQNEQDPDQLENLFRLDHLATRMRRNAESLLVLAGSEPSRRRLRDVDLNDIVRVAVAEVEDYQRIVVVSLDDARVHGGTAIDLAHLLSELMENGSSYSPPETTIEVSGRAVVDGYELVVSDRGMGMTDQQLAEANELFHAPPPLGLSLSRSLGFVVVGALAAKHGVGVRMSRGRAGGTVATVHLPEEVMSGNTDREAMTRPRAADVPAGYTDPAKLAPVAPGGSPAWTEPVRVPAGSVATSGDRAAVHPEPIVARSGARDAAAGLGAAASMPQHAPTPDAGAAGGALDPGSGARVDGGSNPASSLFGSGIPMVGADTHAGLATGRPDLPVLAAPAELLPAAPPRPAPPRPAQVGPGSEAPTRSLGSSEVEAHDAPAAAARGRSDAAPAATGPDGLPKRVPGGTTMPPPREHLEAPPAAASPRSPEEVRELMARYRSALANGREAGIGGASALPGTMHPGGRTEEDR